jgi:TetR/AcrR family tetracycline transcriptional repressor
MASKRTVRLSKDNFVTHALALADAEGLDAVTIRRLGQDYDVSPMALYSHFNDKDGLLDALADRLLEQVKLPEPGDEPWDRELRVILGAFLSAIRPHPEVADLTLRRILSAEAGLAIAERVLELLENAGYTLDRAAETGTFLICAVVTLAAADPARSDKSAQLPKQEELAALPESRYPRVVAAAAALALGRDHDDYFDWNLDLLVEGTRGKQRD